MHISIPNAPKMSHPPSIFFFMHTTKFSVTNEKSYFYRNIFGYGRKIASAQKIQSVGFAFT